MLTVPAISLEESSPTMSDRHYVHHQDEVQLAKILKESKPWLQQYGTTLMYGLAAIIAIAAVVVFIARRPPATAELSRSLLLASTPEDFQAIADTAPESKIGILARLTQAEFTLSQAVGNLFANREVGLEELKSAETTFNVLADRNDVPDDIRERVLVGLARISEARCDGKDDTTRAAVEAWELVLKEFPDSEIYKDIAEERIRKLPLEETRNFYAWFQEQNPKPDDDPQLPQDGPGAVPDIPNMDLDRMLKELPPAPGGTVPTENKPAEPGTVPESTPAEGTPEAPTAPEPTTPEPTTPEPTTPEPTTPEPATPTEGNDTTSPPAEAPATEPAAEAPAAEETPQNSGEKTGDNPAAPAKSGE
jgi:hypothetical protein